MLKVRDLLETLSHFPPEADIAFVQDDDTDGFSVGFNGFTVAGPSTIPVIKGTPIIECHLEIIPWDEDDEEDEDEED